MHVIPEHAGLDEERWLAVRVEPSSDPQPVIDALFASGSLGVQEDGRAVVTHFPPRTSVAEVKDAILAADPGASVSTQLAQIPDWSQWRASVGAHDLGILTIAPPWLVAESDMATTVVIDPEMAFGTGEHATTRGVVRLMQQLGTMPRMVADLGAGSAVLSIAAAKLGAHSVVAIELDPDAIPNAEANVQANGVEGHVHVMLGDATALLPLLAPVDLVLANIISSVLTEMLAVLTGSVPAGGHAILSGILADERRAMISAIGPTDWRIVSEDTEEGWWSVLLNRL